MSDVAAFKRKVQGSKGQARARRKMMHWDVRWDYEGASNWRLWFTGRHRAKIGRRIAKAIGL